jgi:putative nucleotidyltransferase with HDIG domain
MSRYREITQRAVTRLPQRFRSPVAGRMIVYVGVGLIAAFIVCVGSGVTMLVDLAEGTPLRTAATAAFWGATGAATATLVALILMPFIRDGLGLAEDIRLLEAASPAHPLMKELITRAPGTYTHSVATANLAESAAESIGADALLARVGAYYHDVGKIRRPVYFFENQDRGFNPHDEAQPQLSAVIITAHVSDGLELARQYHLPPAILAIIRQHHGTSLVRYFYNKAAAKDAGVFEADFRYQGEKPTTREAALVMLADSCEAAVRALQTPDEPRVRSVVRSIVEDKLADGQLDESSLSVSDMERVVETYSHMLTSMYHARVAYPPAPDTAKGAAGADQHREPSPA